MADGMQTTQLRAAAPTGGAKISRPKLKRAGLALGVITARGENPADSRRPH